MALDRESGIFLHLSSLPGPHGIGDLGATTAVLDWLDRADQSVWQVCPINPTQGVHGHSPYASVSTFAGNPLFVDLTDLVDRGWLSADALADAPRTDRVDYDRVVPFTEDCLEAAFEGFRDRATDEERATFEAFREREAGWLADYSLFVTLRERFDGQPWADWPAEFASRDPDAIETIRTERADRIAYHAFVQWIFDEQWQRFRAAAADRGIDLIGDLPIYVAWDSADVWAHREAFDLRADGHPAAVAGVPPNPGDDGQRWGMPVYDWDALAPEYDWWVARLDRLLALVDRVRIDHFKAFESFWAIPAEKSDPAAGEWRAGPGAAFFERVRAEHGALPFIVEDLGFLDDALATLRDRFEFPGMRVPHYADWCAERHRHKPAGYPERSVAYTSTHDTNTARGYVESLDDRQRSCLEYALATDAERAVWDLLEAVWQSDAALAIAPVQDLLDLGSESRLNDPAGGDDWTWRLPAGALDDALADRLRATTDAALR
ncbi:4-alpha-glucanotransferase [Halococcoides cellulosivorans]|uniref:4-alpha-glucanotransferase n=1 Tax=Halococcoides cellulosivorans TaxID=1679096 RepID=A0A2R4X001_9EURY|nr:4-alpha-glucanotransferase [Halococcoides cellulosivorans]AWB27107.1 4-alpha-glucanotransferase [Halococcoides cellulosivorans]